MSQVTEPLCRAILNGAGVTRNEVEQLARHWLASSAAEPRAEGQSPAVGNVDHSSGTGGSKSESETAVSVLRVTAGRLLAERNALADALRSLRNVVGKLSSRGGNERLTGEVVASMCRADDALAQLTPQDFVEPTVASETVPKSLSVVSKEPK